MNQNKSDYRTHTLSRGGGEGPFYFEIKVFNHLPTSIKSTSHDINKFRFVLKSSLLINSFYSEEYFAWISNRGFHSV
jgi:hypothetical protein